MAAEITTLLNESIIQARDLAHDLGPVGLNGAGLDGALETLALNVRHLFRVTCTFQCDRPFLQPRPEAKSHLVRITQEAVNNAITHGKADRIEISLGSKGGLSLLRIKDNGVGMPVEAPTPEGVGLHTMAYRARLIGGSLEVRRRAPRARSRVRGGPRSGDGPRVVGASGPPTGPRGGSGGLLEAGYVLAPRHLKREPRRSPLVL
jgi:signal transduction histidine kinase